MIHLKFYLEHHFSFDFTKLIIVSSETLLFPITLILFIISEKTNVVFNKNNVVNKTNFSISNLYT